MVILLVKLWLFRGDIDALAVVEENDVDYASKVPGLMHACGHDTHGAMLLGAVKVLNQMKDELKGTVKFFFQPEGRKRSSSNGC